MCFTSKAPTSPKPGISACKAATVACRRSCEPRPVELAQFLAEPEATRKGALDIKAVSSGGIEFQMEAQCDHEQRMFEEKGAQLRGVAEPFIDAHQECFEIGTFPMSRAPTRRMLRLPLLNERPIKEGEQPTIGSNHGIMGKKLRQ